MNNKAEIVQNLHEVYDGWEALLADISEERLAAAALPSNLHIKDVIAHLWAWQQISLARAQAALNGTEPRYPPWPVEINTESEGDVDEINAWIFRNNHDKPWAIVYENWRDQFQRYMELVEQIPEEDLLEPGKYSWMGKYSLIESCEGAFEHHDEHLDDLRAWLARSEEV